MTTDTPGCDGRIQRDENRNLSGPAHAGDPDDEVSLLDLMIALAERKRLIFWVTAAFALGALVLSFLLPVRYTAAVTLLPPQQNVSFGAQLAAQLGSLGNLAQMTGSGGLLKNPNEMYVAMLKSRTVEDAMVQRFGLMREYRKQRLSDARKTLEKYARVDGNSKDGLIHLSVQDADPGRAAALANGYVDQFRALSQNLAITEAQQRRLFFENQLKQANQDLAHAEEALKATEQRTGVIELDSQARALVESAARLRAQIAAQEVQIQAMQTYATGENAQLVEAGKELEGLRAQLARLGGGGDNPDAIIVPKGQMTAAGLEYLRRLRDVRYAETIFEILARQFEMAKLDEAKEGSIIQVVDPAVPPDRKSSPRRGLIVLTATCAGLWAGAFLALVQSKFQNTFRDAQMSVKWRRLTQAVLGPRPR